MNERFDKPGASARAIGHHYDVGNEFYALWLDGATMSYTAALYEGDDDTLEVAQGRKLDHHAVAARATGTQRVLDVGCGWGNLLWRLVEHHAVRHATGLTLSEAQASWIRARSDPRVDVRLEHWIDHEPADPYDAVFSIESMEAFVRPNLSRAEKVETYRTFFERCHRWLRPGGRLSLQVIAYGNARPEDIDPFIAREIFPESDLPALSELFEASERLFEVISLRNDRHHYARTLRDWLARLRARRPEAVALVGADVVARYEQYLRLCVGVFVSGACDLHRLVLHRIDRPRSRKDRS